MVQNVYQTTFITPTMYLTNLRTKCVRMGKNCTCIKMMFLF